MAEQQINSQIQTNNEELTNTITLHDIIRMVIANWYWFVLSTVCCLCAAYYYLASTPKIYSRTATILVKDSRKGGDVDLTAFSDLAGFQNRRNVDNEVFILQSRRLMTNVVKQLNLTVNYSVSERLRRRDLYGQAPIDVKFINDNDNQSLAMEITPIDDDKIRLSGFEDQFVTKHESRSVITAAYGDTIPTPVGQVVVQKSLYMAPDYIGVPIRVTKSSLGRTTNAYRAAVKSDVANKQASVVTISMNRTSVACRSLRASSSRPVWTLSDASWATWTAISRTSRRTTGWWTSPRRPRAACRKVRATRRKVFRSKTRSTWRSTPSPTLTTRKTSVN